MTDKRVSLANQFLEAAKRPRHIEPPIRLWRWCEGCGQHQWHTSTMSGNCETLTCECGYSKTAVVR